MIDSVSSVLSIDSASAASAPSTGASASQPTQPQAAQSQTAQSLADQSQLTDSKPSTRLLIDQDKTTGVFVYRVIDALDGRMLAEIPRESIDQLKNDADYAAGDLISTSV